MQFYPGDWLRDPALRSVSLEARGLWIDMLCLMHESPRRGFLCFADGSEMQPENISRGTGSSPKVVRRLISELEKCWVFSRENGVIYSRRMVRDQQLSQKRKVAGSLGGNPNLLNQTASVLNNESGEQKPTPYSSSSSDPIVPANHKQTKSESVDMWNTPLEQLPEHWVQLLRNAHPKPSMQQPVESWCCDQWNRLGPIRFASLMEAEVMPALRKWTEYWKANGIQYAPQLHHWLISDGWSKTVPALPSGNPNGQPQRPRRGPIDLKAGEV